MMGCGWRLFASCALLTVFLAAPGFAQTDNASCFDCHDDAEMESDDGRPIGVVASKFAKGVHADLDCIDCHSTPGDFEDTPHWDHYTPVDCGECHDDIVDEFAGSVHVIGRFGARPEPVKCTDCHGSAHEIIPASAADSPAHKSNVPNTCLGCHGAETIVTANYVRLPLSVPSYKESVHGEHWLAGDERAAVCTDCHGSHAVYTPQNPDSKTNRRHMADTCGQCHDVISERYGQSVHGQAVAMGIKDAPTCTDCHSEHLIKSPEQSTSRVSVGERARQVCGDCHTNPEILKRYGILAGAVESYLDSYHAWVIDRGDVLAATCTDCHNVHEIRAAADPKSSVNAANVTETCSRCHQNVNATFAQSYTHASALGARGIHDYVRWAYIALIVFALGGMIAHNLVVGRSEFSNVLKKRRQMPRIVRWNRAERVQHMVLLGTFFGLVITGFALRYPNAWWVQMLRMSGPSGEYIRGTLHRSLGIILGFLAVYHLAWVIVTRRGRSEIAGLTPRASDFAMFLHNMAYHFRLRKQRPNFARWDYTQKVEYWAAAWGTLVMALTGLVLWFPTEATSWLPVWSIRVSEVVHFYEAILAFSAIVVWHWFYVLFLPNEYPMSTVWIDGKMTKEEWEHSHPAEAQAMLETEAQARSQTKRS